MVLLKFALARSIELQFFDGATKTTGLAALRPFCTKTQSAASPRLGLAYVLFVCCSSPERGGTGTEPFNRHGDCLPLIAISPMASIYYGHG
jgi:hypothetical protein